MTTTVTFMTKEEFEMLQLGLQQSGKPLMSYLKDSGINYSTYTYWRRKVDAEKKPHLPIAPISFTQHADPVFSGSIPTGASLLFPNGLRAHFGSGTEDVLRDLLDKSLLSHVLP
jgi:putative transposase